MKPAGRRRQNGRSSRAESIRPEFRRRAEDTVTAEVSAPKKASGARIAVQKFGTFLSGMIMPNIAAFIAWGFITALFIEKGPFPVGGIGGVGGGEPRPRQTPPVGAPVRVL